MYSFGMTYRDIKAHLEKIYNVEVPPELISRVTMRSWKRRRGKAARKASIVIGVDCEGQKRLVKRSFALVVEQRKRESEVLDEGVKHSA
jgi:transposase-like protein